MGVFKRYKNAQAAQKDAENAIPGAYQSNYTDRINEARTATSTGSTARGRRQMPGRRLRTPLRALPR